MAENTPKTAHLGHDFQSPTRAEAFQRRLQELARRLAAASSDHESQAASESLVACVTEQGQGDSGDHEPVISPAPALPATALEALVGLTISIAHGVDQIGGGALTVAQEAIPEGWRITWSFEVPRAVLD